MAGAEIGIEWVVEYHGRGTNLPNCKQNAEGFYNKLDGIKEFNWGNDLAWDQDFEQGGVGCPSAGTDHKWVDNVDIAFFSGHGSDKGPSFGVSKHDDGRASSGEVRLGNKDLEWIVYDACEVLRKKGNYYNNAYNMFQGLHFMLGFHTETYDVADRGEIFAEYLNAGYTIRSAWINACKETEASSVKWAYLQAKEGSNNTYNDHWFGKGSRCSDPDPNHQTIIYDNGSC